MSSCLVAFALISVNLFPICVVDVLTKSIRELDSDEVESRRNAAADLHLLALGDRKLLLPVMKRLLHSLRDGDADVRYHICLTLKAIAPELESPPDLLLSELVRLATSDRRENALIAARVLTRFSQPATKLLHAQIMSAKGDQKFIFIVPLGWIGGDAATSIGALESIENLIPPEADGVRLELGRSLVSIAPGNSNGIRLLRAFLNHPDERLKEQAALALAQSNSNRAELVPYLRSRFASADGTRFNNDPIAIRSIWEARDFAKQIRPTLDKLFQKREDEDVFLRHEDVLFLAGTLLHIDPRHDAARRYLVGKQQLVTSLLDRPYSEGHRYLACVLIGMLHGPDSKKLRQIAANDPSMRVRQAASEAIHKIGKGKR